MDKKIIIKAYDATKNEEFLKTVPHKLMEDIAFVYCYEADATAGVWTAPITYEIMEFEGLTLEQLEKAAMQQALTERPAVIEGMQAHIMKNMYLMGQISEAELEMMCIPFEEEPMCIASVKENCFGASVLVYPSFCEELANKFGDDFYIIPSSIHELVLFPVQKVKLTLLANDPEEAFEKKLKGLVKEVNSSQLLPQDVLTDSLYLYSRKAGFQKVG